MIGFNGGMSVFVDSVKKNASLVETAIKAVTGNKLRLKTVSLPQEKKDANGIKKEVSLNPVVKNALELFSGKILKVKSLKKTDNTD